MNASLLATNRLEWIDIAKGVGIILVVVGHTGRGLSAVYFPDGTGFLQSMDKAIYAFHMPLFFLLSGITFGMRPPSTIQPALLNRALRFFYTLVVWTYAFLGMRALAGDMSNAGGSWLDLLQAPLPPFAHFWFLWALLINMVLFAVLRLEMRSILPDILFWTVATFVSVAVSFTVNLPQQFAPWLGHALDYSFVFTVGGIIGSSQLVRAVPSLTIASLGSLLFVFFLWASISIELPINDVVGGLVLSLLLLLPLITLSTYLGRSAGGRALAFLGVISLAIYVMHIIFSAGIRIALINGGYFDLKLHLVSGIFAGILGPLLVYLMARRANMLRILGLA